MATVTIRYWAAAKEAAGVAEDTVEAGTLAQALDAALARRDPDGRLGRVVARSSFLVDGAPVGRRIPADLALHEGAVIEVLPAFAGG
jgi:molybdopterin synthase sulfur carrier subunit